MALACIATACGREGSPRPAPLPAIVSLGGPVLDHAQVVTISFADDPDSAEEEAWLDWALSSTWLPAATAEYGVGAASVADRIRLAEMAPATFSEADVTTWISSHAGSSIPMPAQELLYVIYFPQTTALAYKGTYCMDFSGYHTDITVAGMKVPVALVGRCKTFWAGLDELQNVERTASHELVEALTDPFFHYAPAYRTRSDARDAQSALALASGDELGDTCHGSQVVVDNGFIGQRIWSNTNALAATDPCSPEADAPFFEVTTQQPWYGVTAGSAVSINLQGWSEEPLDDWYVTAVVGGGSGFSAVITSDEMETAGSGSVAKTNAGRNVTVTVTAPASAAKDDSVGVAVRSISPASFANRDATREAEYHEFPFGVYVK